MDNNSIGNFRKSRKQSDDDSSLEERKFGDQAKAELNLELAVCYEEDDEDKSAFTPGDKTVVQDFGKR